MALTTFAKPGTAAVVLSTSYLGTSDDIEIDSCGTQVHLWSDDDAILLTYKFSVNGGPYLEIPAGAVKDIWVIDKERNTDMRIDAKSASGTPSVNVMVT
jgi:hypothetical protein